MDLGLILGPIVLAVVFNVRSLRFAHLSPPVYTFINRVLCTERVSASGTTTIPRGIRTRGIPGTRATVTPGGTATHKFPQAPRRVGRILGYLPHGRRNVYVMGIRGTEFRKVRDLCPPTLVSLFGPHLVSPHAIRST